MGLNRAECGRRAALLLAACAALATAAGARAEYACTHPQTQADRHACALARLERPDDLRRFIERTRGVYNLYMPDYVSDADVRRWDAVRLADKSAQAAVGIAQETERKSIR